MQTAKSIPASAASRMASADQGAGTKIMETVALVCKTASATESKTGNPSMEEPPRPGVTPPTIFEP